MAETIPNKPLNGTELQQIIQADITRMLSMDGMLKEYMSYGRVSTVITVKLLLDNPAYPEHVINIRPQPTKAHPQIVTAPVKNVTPEAVKLGRQRTRTIDNPNLERLKHKLPISKIAIDPSDGKQKTQELNYTAESAGLTEADVNPDNGTVDKELTAMEVDL
jgi:hypothetical protein